MDLILDVNTWLYPMDLGEFYSFAQFLSLLFLFLFPYYFIQTIYRTFNDAGVTIRSGTCYC